MSKITRAIRLILAGTLLSVTTASALIGNLKLGDFSVPCLVACGGEKGIVNFSFLGDLSKSFVFDPALNKFDNILTSHREAFLKEADGRLRSILSGASDRLEQIADNQRSKLNEDIEYQRQALEEQLSGLAKQATSDLDQLADEKIKSAEAAANQQFAQLHGGLVDSISRLNRGLVTVGAVFVSFAMIAALGVFLYASRNRTSSFLFKSLAVLCGTVGIAILIGYAYEYDSERRTRQSLGVSLDAAYKRRDLWEVIYILEVWGKVFPEEEAYAAKKEALKILRDMSIKPGIYASPEKAQAYIKRAYEIQDLLTSNGYSREPELDSVVAKLIWSLGDTRGAEHEAARFAASALMNCRNNNRCFGSDLSSRVLKTYLESPVSAENLSSFESVPEGKAGFPARLPDTEILYNVLAKQPEMDVSKEDRLNSLHVRTIDLYSRAVLLHARSFSQLEEGKKVYPHTQNIINKINELWMADSKSYIANASLTVQLKALNSFYIAINALQNLPVDDNFDEEASDSEFQQRVNFTIGKLITLTKQFKELPDKAKRSITSSVDASDIYYIKLLDSFQRNVVLAFVPLNSKVYYFEGEAGISVIMSQELKTSHLLEALRLSSKLGLFICADPDRHSRTDACSADMGMLSMADVLLKAADCSTGCLEEQTADILKAARRKRLSMPF